MVGKPDPLIISKRDFCTCSPYKDTSKAPSTTGGMSDRGGGPIFSSTPKGDQSLYSKYLVTGAASVCQLRNWFVRNWMI